MSSVVNRFGRGFLARDYLSTPCKVDTPATLQHSLRVAGGGRLELKWSHRLRECLPAQRHPPLHLSPVSISILLPAKKTQRQILERRLQRERRKPYSYATLPQDVSHGRGHSRRQRMYNPFAVTVTNFREDGPSSPVPLSCIIPRLLSAASSSSCLRLLPPVFDRAPI